MNAHNIVMPLNEARLFIQADKATRQGYLQTAVQILDRLLHLNPNNVPALINMGTLLEYTGKPERVVGIFRRAVELAPDNVQAHHCLGLSLLNNGILSEGWKEYQWRLKYPSKRTLQDKFDCPMWNGEALAGKRVVIWTDQGIGDEILAGTMLKDLMKEKATYSIVCSPRMMPILNRTFRGVVIWNREAIERGDAVHHEFDYQISVSELGKVLRPNEQSFPKWSAYLDWNTGQTQYLKKKYNYNQEDKFLIGISWESSHPVYGNSKSIPISEWKNILYHPDCQFVNLQYGSSRLDVKENPLILTDYAIDPMISMDAFVAQVAAMDAVISVSNTTVHVAGALGIPVINILPTSRAPIWYWFRDRSDSPWYRSMQLIRREADGTVMPKVEKAFAEYIAG